MIWMMEDGRWWKCCSLQVAPPLSQLGNKTVATSSSSDSAARIAFDVSGPQQQQRRWCREKVRWTILFFAATQIAAGALGEKGKLQNQNWQHHLCSPVQILWHLLTSAKEKCCGDKYSIPSPSTLSMPMSSKCTITLSQKTIVYVCVSTFGSRHLAPPWCLIGRRGRSESIARVRLNYQPQELTGPRYPILSNSSPRRTTFAQK